MSVILASFAIAVSLAVNHSTSTTQRISRFHQRRTEPSYYASRDTADQTSTGHWSPTAAGAGIGLVVGAIAGVAAGRYEDRNCGDGPCYGPTIRGVEFGVLGTIFGAVIGYHWHPGAASFSLQASPHGSAVTVAVPFQIRVTPSG